MSGARPGPLPILALAVLAVAATSAPASAQYFGRNKVHYQTFKFEVLKTDHFDLYFYPAEREGIEIAARLAERWNARLERTLGHELRGRQPLILYASHTDFEQTNTIAGEIGEGTGGVTEGLRRRIILPLGGPLADSDHVIGHELVHAFQFDMTTTPDMGPGETGASRLPLWFIEGMAEYLSIGPVDAHTAMWLRDAAREERLPEIEDLDNPRYFPYRWGQAFWAYVAGRWGDDVVADMLTTAAATGSVDKAIEQILAIDAKALSADWHAAIRQMYGPVLNATVTPAETGRLVLGGRESGSDLNVGPSISPDGRWVAFLSERSLFSIELYIAELSTGRIVRKLTSTATDPHFSSIQFIYSAGAWDSASRRLAVATVANGKPTLAIFEAETGKLTREITVTGVDEIRNPTWAPDGHAIAFSGMSQGLTDLFAYDLNANTLRQLTDDAFADVHPAWSPDGKRIAFATDRYSSQLDTLAIGAYRLALFDLATSAIEPVQAFLAGKHINPQWAPDGRSLYFISDHDGISNLYRVALAAGAAAPVQMTKVSTGISGISGSSPALSVSAKSGAVAFTVYDAGRYQIHTLDPSHVLPDGEAIPANAAALPPAERTASDVAAVLDDPTFGLPEAAAYPTEPYRPRLSLEGIAQPSVGLGVSRFGTTLGGGLSLYFTDMLGDHVLVTNLQLSSTFGNGSSFKDFGAQVAYINQAQRWNWGITGGQIPYLSGGYQSQISRQGNDLIQTDQMIIYRQTERSASGLLAYPFDRSRRIEFQGGATQISFDQVVNTQSYSLRSGVLYENNTETTSIAPSLTLATSSAAFVVDTSTFGATSPVQGQRLRLEATPTFGTLNFTGLLADYRRYEMPVSFYTIASRVMHYGRYGRGGEDTRLFPTYIGYPNLVRGYDVNSFDASECIADGTSSCPAIDRLLGSRMLVGNLEFRFPLLRPFGVTTNMYGPLPIEVALFADGGVAWNSGQTPSLLGGSRGGVGSAGVAFRMNLFGFAVGEFNIARPFQRPGRGVVYSFNLSPGW
jgi:Tol biopolymer transport system component